MTPEERFERIEKILEETAVMQRSFEEAWEARLREGRRETEEWRRESENAHTESQRRLLRIEENLLVASEMQRRHEEKWDKHFAELAVSQQGLYTSLQRLAEILANIFGPRRRSNGDEETKT